MTLNLHEINQKEQTRIRDLEALISKAVQSLKMGLPVIVTDDDDRENEGDFIYLAEKITPQSMNFLVTEARGLVCVAIDESIAKRLKFSMMVKNNEDLHGTAFTVSVDHIETTTGISAYERALTVNKIASMDSIASDFRRPGHIFPLIGKEGGVLKRRGHTEAAVDLAKLAGAEPAGVICEILKADGQMARRDDLIEIAKLHDLVMLTIEDLVQYRQIHDKKLLQRIAKIKLPSFTLTNTNALNNNVSEIDLNDNTSAHLFSLYGYKNELDDQEHLALVSGDLTKIDVPLVRIHSECLTGDVFGSLRCDCGPQLNLAKYMIAQEGGVILYMRQEGRGIGLLNKLKAYELQEKGYDTVEANHQLGFDADLRRYELCALMLKDLGITQIRLMTNNPEKIQALAELGIEVVERVPLITGLDKENLAYMNTKKNKMSHLLEK